jgi:hypothetical protein
MESMILIAALLLGTLQEPVAKTWNFDCSSGTPAGNLAVEMVSTVFNPQDGKSVTFFHAGASRLEAKLELPAAPDLAVLELEHLSSGGPVKFGGNSRISVLINGEPLIGEWEVGSHAYHTDRLAITKMLRAGDNTLRISFLGGDTVYWLRRLEIACTFPPGTAPVAPTETIPGEGAYAVVVSHATYADPEWREVVDALVTKHDASVVIHSLSVHRAREALTAIFPREVCFVVKPEEAGREFVIAVHRMTRALDDDPYGDVRWGIITGYRAADAMRIACYDEPLLVSRFGAGTGFGLDGFEEGVAFSESEQGVKSTKEVGGEPLKQSCADDATAELVAVLNDYAPDYFMTSGHATSRDWQIGYRFKSGQFRCQDGQLFGLDLDGKRFDVTSPNPKIYTASGNCLMGLVDGDQAMALAWMHSAGVKQMVGYVVSTWYGFGGRCEKDLFLAQEGRFTLAESFFLQNQLLLHRLQTRFPKTASVNFDRWNIESNQQLINQLAQEHQLTDRDEIGLLWDRDTVAFYGDPAWEARLKSQRTPAWSQELTEEDGTFRFEVLANTGGTWSTPATAFLPYRVEEIEITAGAELNPVITDDFILLPLEGARIEGESVIVEWVAVSR